MIRKKKAPVKRVINKRQKLIKPSRPILKNNFFCYIKLKKSQVDVSGIKQMAEIKGFKEQTFRHITILSTSNFRTIKDALNKNVQEEMLGKIRQKIKQLDWKYKQNGVYLISKKISEVENRQSYIRAIKMPSINIFFKYLNRIFHSDLPTQYPHITLFTKGEIKNANYYGISIPSKKEFKFLRPIKVC